LSDAQLVRLTPEAAESDEVTIYVKGFLARGEEPDHFDAWLDSHREAAQRHGWGPHAVGYRWPSGDVGHPPIPYASAVKIAWDVYSLVSKVRRVNIPATVALTAGEELARIALRFASEYRAAERAAHERAETFAAVLSELRVRYARVRVVAHSLGCRHAIEAISALTASERPDTVHLCAPACREDAVAERLDLLARERTALYFTPDDLVLRTGFALMSGGTALGSSGPEDDYVALESVDVSEYFQFWTHLEYKRQFGRIAQR
jgi:hypothetical protein